MALPCLEKGPRLSTRHGEPGPVLQASSVSLPHPQVPPSLHLSGAGVSQEILMLPASGPPAHPSPGRQGGGDPPKQLTYSGDIEASPWLGPEYPGQSPLGKEDFGFKLSNSGATSPGQRVAEGEGIS